MTENTVPINSESCDKASESAELSEIQDSQQSVTIIEKSPQKPATPVELESSSKESSSRDSEGSHRTECSPRSDDRGAFKEDASSMHTVEELEFGLSIQKPLTPGATGFSSAIGVDDCCRRCLCRNETGIINLAVPSPGLEKFAKSLKKFDKYTARQEWMNLMASGNIEVESLEAGDGRRSFTIPNAAKGYYLGAIGSEGFALGRGSIRKAKGAPSNFLSRFEYRPFDTKLSSPLKASWLRCFPPEESLVAIACGDGFVAVATSGIGACVRVFSAGGLLLTVASLAEGPAISLAARRDMFMLIEQIVMPVHQMMGEKDLDDLVVRGPNFVSDFDVTFDSMSMSCKKYAARVFQLSRKQDCLSSLWIHEVTSGQGASFCLFGDPMEEITWCGLSNDLVPLVVTSQGKCLALLVGSTSPGFVPREIEHLAIHAETESLDEDDDVSTTSSGFNVESVAMKVKMARSGLSDRYRLHWCTVIESIPRSLSHPSTPQDPTASPDKAKSPGSSTASQASVRKYLVLGGDSDCLLVQEYTGDALPTAMRTDRGVRVPFRLPILGMPGMEELMEPSVWFDQYNRDPSLSLEGKKDPNGSMYSLPWIVWDEIRLRRLKMQLCNACMQYAILRESGPVVGATQLGVGQAPAHRGSSISKLRKDIEIASMKECLKLFQEGGLDQTIETSCLMSYGGSLNRLSNLTRQHGDKVLSTELELLKERFDFRKQLRGQIEEFLQGNPTDLRLESYQHSGMDPPPEQGQASKVAQESAPTRPVECHLEERRPTIANLLASRLAERGGADGPQPKRTRI